MQFFFIFLYQWLTLTDHNFYQTIFKFCHFICDLGQYKIKKFFVVVFCCFFVLFCFGGMGGIDSLRPSQHFFSHVRMGTKQRIKCLAQGHNAVPPVKLKPTTP